MAFSPSHEGNKIADVFPLEIFCKFLEKVSFLKGTKKKKQNISEFMRQWGLKYKTLDGNTGSVAGDLGSFYPVLRLLIPSADRARPAYGIRESTMAKMLIKAFGLSDNGPNATRLLGKNSSSVPESSFDRDLADIAYCVLKDYCAIKSVYTITKFNEILDELSSSVLHEQKLAVISRFVHNATIIELKWFVRIVSRRDLSFGIGDKAILSCLHPAAPPIWDVTQDLHVVCQRIANIDPSLASPDGKDSKLTSIELFTAFKPMLCSRANSFEEICTAYQQDFSGYVDSGLCLEAKYDGERVQLHKSGTKYRFWSRNGREWSSSYGESGNFPNGSLTYRLHANGTAFASHVIDCILDGEMLAFDRRQNRFVTKAMGYDVKRFRFEDQTSCNEDVMPCFVVFDIIYLNGELLMKAPLAQRKCILLTIFTSFKYTCEDVSLMVEDYLKPIGGGVSALNLEDGRSWEERLLSVFPIVKGALYLGGFMFTQPVKLPMARCFDTWVQNGAEGLVAKALCSTYTPNGRAHGGWWKLKPDYLLGVSTDLDCLIVGAYAASASTTAVVHRNRFSTFLCGVLNNVECNDSDENKRTRSLLHQSTDSYLPSFLTFCQVSNGLKQDQLEMIYCRLGPYWRPYDRRNINIGETEWLRVTGERPDFWIPPCHSLVLQIHAAEMIPSASYSAGFTLRFPRVLAIREEKTWESVALISEIKQLYLDTKGKMLKMKSERSSEVERDIIDEDNVPANATSTYDPSSSRRIRKRPKLLAEYHAQKIDPVEVESSVFTGMEFCLYISSRFNSSDPCIATKVDLENAILRRSGNVVQSPGCDTTFVITDRITLRISNLIEATRKAKGQGKEGGYDIVAVEWLIKCIQANRLLPLHKDIVFAARPSTMRQLNIAAE